MNWKSTGILAGLAVIFGVAGGKAEANGYCGAGCYSCCPTACQPCYTTCRVERRTCYRTVREIVYEQQQVQCQRTEYDTVYEDRPVTCYRNVTERKVRECQYQVSRPVWECAEREERYTVSRPVWETSYRDCSYTVRKPIWETATRECRRTVQRYLRRLARIKSCPECGLPLTAESVLMEGARILDEWPMVEKRVGSYSGVFRRTKAAEQTLGATQGKPGIVLSGEERAILQNVDGQRTVQDLIDCSLLSEFDTCRVLYELIGRELGVIPSRILQSCSSVTPHTTVVAASRSGARTDRPRAYRP
jgi:hypothetical protein